MEEEQAIQEDEIARYHVEYNALNVAIQRDMSFLEYYEMKTRNGHRRNEE